MQVDGPLLIELKTDPLALVLTAGGKTYGVPLLPLAAQSLGMALLSLVGNEPLPELLAAIEAEQATRTTGVMYAN
jgi:hypothetical protein